MDPRPKIGLQHDKAKSYCEGPKEVLVVGPTLPLLFKDFLPIIINDMGEFEKIFHPFSPNME